MKTYFINLSGRIIRLICFIVTFNSGTAFSQNFPVNNISISAGDHLYYSSGSIASPDSSIHPVQITSDANVTFIAGQSITLN